MSIVGWFWVGCISPLALKLGKHLRSDWKRRKAGPTLQDPNVEEPPVGFWGVLLWLLGELADFFFEDTAATMTTLTTVVFGWIVVAMWVGEIVNFIWPFLGELPQHGAIALGLGLAVEAGGAKLAGKFFDKVFA